MSDYIPDEVWKKILAYLPPKSLVRFTCVCKSWQSLITSSAFVTDHLNRTKLSNNNLISVRYCPGNHQKERYSLRIDNHTFDQYDVIEFPFLSKCFAEYFHVLASCNGLICLSDDYMPITHTVVLWNPSIRKYLTLPRPNFTYLTHGPFDHAIGFGFDSRTNDYKVVRIVNLESEEDQSPRVELYKLSTGYWETITATVDPLFFVEYMYGTQAFVNGAVHWPGFKRDSGASGALIMSFNISDEVFHEIRLPAGVAHIHFVDRMPVAVCGEWLSCVHYTTDFHKSCSVWVMKEYGVVESWTKLYAFNLNGGLGEVLGFRRNGELLLAMRNIELVSYDPKTQQIKNLGICDSNTKGCSFHVDAHVESLVLLEGANRGRTCDNESEEEKEEDACDKIVEDKEEQVLVDVTAATKGEIYELK